jgi:serine/threonine protein kinase
LFRAKWRGLDVCVKTLDADRFAEGKDPRQAIYDLQNEISILSTLRHPNLVLFLGAVLPKELSGDSTDDIPLLPSTKTMPLLITEFMDGKFSFRPSCMFMRSNFAGGNLRELLMANKVQDKRIPPDVAFRWTKEFALGINFLHKCSTPIIHRDLKPENLLFNSRNMQAASLKIADFGMLAYHVYTLLVHASSWYDDMCTGLGKLFSSKSSTGSNEKGETEKYYMTGGTGSYRYMAPEIFMSKGGKGFYNETVDVYSWALITWSIHTGQRPFHAEAPIESIDAAKLASADPKNRPDLKFVTPGLGLILQKAWSHDPDERPSFNDILQQLDSIAHEYRASTSACTACAIQ